MERSIRISRLSHLSTATGMATLVFPILAALFAVGPTTAGSSTILWRAWFVRNPTGIFMNALVTIIGISLQIWFMGVLYRFLLRHKSEMKMWAWIAAGAGILASIPLIVNNILLATVAVQSPPSLTLIGIYIKLGNLAFFQQLVSVLALVSVLTGSLVMIHIAGWSRWIGRFGLLGVGIGLLATVILFFVIGILLPLGAPLWGIWVLSTSIAMTLRPNIINQHLEPHLKSVDEHQPSPSS